MYKRLSADAITVVKFYIKDSHGGSGKTIQLCALSGNSTWTESNVTWNTVGTASSALTSASVGNGAWSSFNITSLVKGWKNGTYTAGCGFLLKNASESQTCNFFSSESAQANWPYVVMTYSPEGSGGSGSISNATTLTLGSSTAVHIAYANEKRYFKYTPSSDGFYIFESSANTGYYFAAGCFGTGTGNYSVKIVKATSAPQIGTSLCG